MFIPEVADALDKLGGCVVKGMLALGSLRGDPIEKQIKRISGQSWQPSRQDVEFMELHGYRFNGMADGKAAWAPIEPKRQIHFR